MKYLLSLPENAASSFELNQNKKGSDWFSTSDPKDKRVGSGGGSVWLLEEAHRSEQSTLSFEEWLHNKKRILIHAGGQSRRLPAYAAGGKSSIPIPVFRWKRGQKLSQNLLSLQLPLYEKLLAEFDDNQNTLIASGDVLIRTEEALPTAVEADVVCYGLWVDSALATRHGVFASKRESPETLDMMMQKPDLQQLEQMSQTHFFLMDVGVWVLSDRAVEVLRKRSYNDQGELSYYNLYSDFGLALGDNPTIKDSDINALTVKIIPLQGGSFHHFGTSREIISSSLDLQNVIRDQRLIMHRKIKPNSSIFTQNAEVVIQFSTDNHNIWIENSFVSNQWSVTSNNIITGVPKNEWQLKLRDGVCIDIVPLEEKVYAVRPYGIDDTFSGNITDEGTLWMGISLTEWLKKRELSTEDVVGEEDDILLAKLFPQVNNMQDAELIFKWMTDESPESHAGRSLWLTCSRYSANDLMNKASLKRLHEQRLELQKLNYKMLEKNHEMSVFYQLDLKDTAEKYYAHKLTIPNLLPSDNEPMRRIYNHMLRSRILKLNNETNKAKIEEQHAFSILRNEMIYATPQHKLEPQLAVYSDQIVWGRSPVRIDLAGGWTDTPPYAMYAGGNVVNLAIELNGQPPLQVYIRPLKEFHISLRSIDMGSSELVTDFETLKNFNIVGSPFSIPKAALALSGFHPDFSPVKYATLENQLKAFGSGIEITLLSAIPAGSGLGTSSILASTVLGTLNDFCNLQWSKHEISINTLILEQLLTTGGGWQDQYGGVFHGIKLLQSERGFLQQPQISWLPDYLFTDPMFRSTHLLYYTGITRVAKNILKEIVKGMFLNSSSHLEVLNEMKAHAMDMTHVVQKGNFNQFGAMVLKTWGQKQRLDKGTNPPLVDSIINRIKEYCIGYTLPGAGGGGYLYMIAKDEEAAGRIKKELISNPPNNRARFVDVAISDKGFQVSRS